MNPLHLANSVAQAETAGLVVVEATSIIVGDSILVVGTVLAAATEEIDRIEA